MVRHDVTVVYEQVVLVDKDTLLLPPIKGILRVETAQKHSFLYVDGKRYSFSPGVSFLMKGEERVLIGRFSGKLCFYAAL